MVVHSFGLIGMAERDSDVGNEEIWAAVEAADGDGYDEIMDY